MTSQLFAICFNATRPSALARFWSGVLGWEPADGPDDDVTILPPVPPVSASASCPARSRSPSRTGRIST